MLPLELALVHQIFGQAVSDAGNALYEVITCALAPGSVRTSAFSSATAPDAVATAQTVVVPASHETDERLDVLDEPLR